ncbi:MAG: hypothetical protein Q4E37_06575 [Tissierellia bacterium]|nr:hypothetical protein [Tissierellia bacterium]
MENGKKHPALVLDTSTATGLSVVRNLGRRGVPVTTMDFFESKFGISRYVDQAFIVPHYKKEEDLFLQYILDYAQGFEKKPVLFFTDPAYLGFLYKHFDLLKEYFLFPLEDKKGLTYFLDRSLLRKTLVDQGVRLPASIQGRDPALKERVLDELGYPCLLRSYREDWLEDLLGPSPLLLEDEGALLGAMAKLRGQEDRYFVQALVDGPDSKVYYLSAYYGAKGVLRGLSSSQALRLSPKGFGQASYLQQKWIPDALPLIQPFFQALKWRGFVEATFKRDEFSSQLYLLDIRPSFSPYNALLCDLGFEAPYMYYLDALGQVPPSQILNQTSHRYWKDLFLDLSASWSYLRSREMSLIEILSSYNFTKSSSIFAFDDLGPGLAYLSSALMEGASRARQQVVDLCKEKKYHLQEK